MVVRLFGCHPRVAAAKGPASLLLRFRGRPLAVALNGVKGLGQVREVGLALPMSRQALWIQTFSLSFMRSAERKRALSLSFFCAIYPIVVAG
jgi:hypothetical protein